MDQPAYVCSVCNKSYKTNNILLNHKNKYHKQSELAIDNPIKYVELGKENLSKFFNKKQKLMLLKMKGSPIENIIEYTHLNERYPQFQTVIINNDRAFKIPTYNEELNKFVLCNKNEILNKMIQYRFNDLITFYNEYNHLLDQNTIEHLEKHFLIKDNPILCKNICKVIEVNIYNHLKYVIV